MTVAGHDLEAQWGRVETKAAAPPPRSVPGPLPALYFAVSSILIRCFDATGAAPKNCFSAG